MGAVVKLVLALLNPEPPGAFNLAYLSKKKEQNKTQTENNNEKLKKRCVGSRFPH